MNESIGAFIVTFYVVVWIFTALNYDKGEDKGNVYVWVITLFWPLLLVLKSIKK